jgi:hypothetical protein
MGFSTWLHAMNRLGQLGVPYEETLAVTFGVGTRQLAPGPFTFKRISFSQSSAEQEISLYDVLWLVVRPGKSAANSVRRIRKTIKAVVVICLVRSRRRAIRQVPL